MPTIKHWILRRRDQSPARPVAHQLHHQLNGLYLPSIGLGISSPYAPIRTDKGYDGQALEADALKCFQATFCVHVFWLRRKYQKIHFSHIQCSAKYSFLVRNDFIPYFHFLVFADNF